MLRVISKIEERHYEPIDPTVRWGVANMNWAVDWWLMDAYKTWSNFPMSAMKSDTPSNRTRGRNIPVTPSMWRFVRKINNPAGYNYTRLVGFLIINRPFLDENGILHESPWADSTPSDPDPMALCEPIVYPANPYQITDETATHYRIGALVHDETDWDSLDPAEWCWEKMPHIFPKMCAEARNKTIQNVMGGIDSFWINLALTKKDGAWVEKKLIALAPDPRDYVIEGSRGVGYRLHGAHWIMGLENGRQVYVRRVTKAEGVIDYYGWKPNFRSVVPPAWFK